MCFLYSETNSWVIPADKPLTIGRGMGNTVRVSNRFVSLFHARIEVSTGQAVLHDLNSTNGVFVNGRKISGVAALKNGDRITLGNETFFFSDNETALIVSWTDRLRVWMVRRQKVMRIALAILPFLVVVEERVIGGIEKLLTLLIELIQ